MSQGQAALLAGQTQGLSALNAGFSGVNGALSAGFGGLASGQASLLAGQQGLADLLGQGQAVTMGALRGLQQTQSAAFAGTASLIDTSAAGTRLIVGQTGAALSAGQETLARGLGGVCAGVDALGNSVQGLQYGLLALGAGGLALFAYSQQERERGA